MNWLDDTKYDALRASGYDDSSARGTLFVSSLSDEDLLAGARDRASSGYRQVLAFLGSDTNPSWITAQCATAAYERGLMGENEMDSIVDE